MDKDTAEKLEGSIVKWEGIVDGTVENDGPRNCPLCQKFAHAGMPLGERCNGCPVMERTGQRGCNGSPYVYYIAGQPSATKAAQEELDFLKSLRDEKITSLTERNGHTYTEIVTAWMDHPELVFLNGGPRGEECGMVNTLDWDVGHYTIVEVHNYLTWEQVDAGYPRKDTDPNNGFQYKPMARGSWHNSISWDQRETLKETWRKDEIRIDPDFEPGLKFVEPVILYWGMTAAECYADYTSHPERWEYKSLIDDGWRACTGHDSLVAVTDALRKGRKRRKYQKPTVEQRLEAIEAQLVLGKQS